MIDAQLALKALDEARAVRADIAGRVRCPPYRHWLFGLLMGSLVAAPAAPLPYEVAIFVVCMIAVALLIRDQRRRLGFFVNGYRKGRTLWIALPLLVFTETLLYGGMWLKYERHLAWAPLVGGAIMLFVGAAASYAWQRVYRAELTGDAPGPV